MILILSLGIILSFSTNLARFAALPAIIGYAAFNGFLG
jgi:hypothetical protein